MMAVSAGQNGTDCLKGSDSHILTVDKHLIPLTGADRHNDSFVISGRPKGGTYQFRPDCAAFSDSMRMLCQKRFASLHEIIQKDLW